MKIESFGIEFDNFYRMGFIIEVFGFIQFKIKKVVLRIKNWNLEFTRANNNQWRIQLIYLNSDHC